MNRRRRRLRPPLSYRIRKCSFARLNSGFLGAAKFSMWLKFTCCCEGKVSVSTNAMTSTVSQATINSYEVFSCPYDALRTLATISRYNAVAKKLAASGSNDNISLMISTWNDHQAAPLPFSASSLATCVRSVPGTIGVKAYSAITLLRRLSPIARFCSIEISLAGRLPLLLSPPVSFLSWEKRGCGAGLAAPSRP